MQCRVDNHSNLPILGFCVNPNCDYYSLYCRKCYREFHKEHMEDCYTFDEGAEQLENILVNQESLKKSLTGLLQTIQTKSGVLIQNLERNIKIIKDLNNNFKEQRLDDIKKNVALIKHFYGFQVQAQSGYGTKIENVIHDFLKMQEELEVQIKMLSNPSALYISKGNQLYQQKGQELLNDKQYDKAIIQFEKAINLDYLSIDALILKAKALRNMKVYEQAQSIIDQALRINKNNFKVLLEQGNLLRDLNKFKEAFIQFEECLKIDANNKEAILGKADCLLGFKQYNDAFNLYDEILKIDENNYFALIGNVQALAKLKKFVMAQQLFGKAQKIEPNNQKRFFFEAMLLKEQILDRLQKNELEDPQYSFAHCCEDAMNCFVNELQLNPENIEAMLERCINLIYSVDLQLQIHDRIPNEKLLKSIIHYCDLTIKHHPGTVSAFTILGRALIFAERTTEAIVCCDQGLQLDPENEDLKNIKIKAESKKTELYIESLIEQKNIVEAVRLLKTSTLSERKGYYTYEKLIILLLEQKNLIEALDIQHKQYQLTNYLAEEKKLAPEMFDNIKKRYTLFCNNQEIIQVNYYSNKNNIKEFLNALKKFYNYHLVFTLIIIHIKVCLFLKLGDCLLSIGQFEEAQVAYEEMLKGNRITQIIYLQRKAQCLNAQEKIIEAINYYQQYINESLEFIKKNNDKIKRGLLEFYLEDDLQTTFDLKKNYFNFSMFSFQYLGIALGKVLRFNEAVQMIDKVIALDQEYDEAYEFKRRFLIFQGKEEEAEKVNQIIKKRQIKTFPNEKTKIIKLENEGLSLIQENRLEEAIEIYVQLITIVPTFVNFYLQLSKLLNMTFKSKQSIKYIDQAIILEPENHLIYQFQSIYSEYDIVTIIQQRIKKLVNQNKPMKAFSLLSSVLKVDQMIFEDFAKQENLFDLIGNGLLNQSMYNQAIESFDQQIFLYEEQKDKHFKNALYFKCLSLYRLQQYDQVLIYIEQLITQDDCKSKVFSLLGDTLFMKQKYDESIIGYQEALQRELNYHFYINIGDCLVQMQQYKQAIEQYDLLLTNELQIDQNLKNIALMHKAQVLIIQEQNESAVLLLKQVIANDTKHTFAYYHLAQTLLKFGNTNEAQQVLDQAKRHGLEINDQTEPQMMTITALISDKAIPLHPF